MWTQLCRTHCCRAHLQIRWTAWLSWLLAFECRTLKELRLRSDQTDVVFGCSHISQPVLSHLACCPGLRRLGISSAELMSVDLGALRHLVLLEVLALNQPTRLVC